ncbi:MAG TPA: YciI family protein [Mycobacteriales bacterium]|nr:YciI family protein [Mycobacteriales bacterium]
MKYMLLIYNNPDAMAAMSPAERDEVFATVDTVMKGLAESGELVGGQALTHPSTTRTVRVRDGAVVTTDGPFAESKEHFAGYIEVDCESEERAVEIAASWPDARYCAMEVRAVMHESGGDV